MSLSRIAPLVLGIGSLLLASGCHMVVGSESEGWWYCDDSGCYECTPYGCRGLPDRVCRGDDCSGDGPAPTPSSCAPDTPCQNPDPTCNVSSDCRSGYICTKGACVPGKVGDCEEHSHCGLGAICVDGACQDTTLCTKDEDCLGDLVCDIRKTCAPAGKPAEPKPEPKPVCEDASTCDGGFCLDGKCGECAGEDCGAAKTCALDRHCGKGRVCLDGQCTASCAEGVDACASGQECKSGVCVADDSLFCTASSECGAGNVCLNNACRGACTDTGACSNANDLCSEPISVEGEPVRVCQPDHRAQLECKLTKDCEGGETCTNGVCRTVCTDAPDCAACDDGPVCGPGGFCMTTDEAKPECTLSDDCSGEAICLGAKCTTL